jgi:hypothetical protein
VPVLACVEGMSDASLRVNCEIRLELAGEHAKSVRVTVPLTSGGTTHVCIGSVVLKHAKFIVAFHGRLEANLVQARVCTACSIPSVSSVIQCVCRRRLGRCWMWSCFCEVQLVKGCMDMA